MAEELRFEGKVAIVTGAGGGLGRAHALLLASRGAKLVVNDLGGGRHGGGKSSAAADQVVTDIKAAGGEAVANYDSVEDGAKIVQNALDAFGRVDIVVNNAGVLRDQSFRKMTEEDWEVIYRVHVLGGFRVTHAAWPHLIEQGYGRVIMTASAAGIYGNFGQANYAMAKLGLVGFAQTLALEGKKKNVLVNAIAPLAGSRLTETVMPKELLDVLKPELVSPLVAWLCHERCEETGGLFEVGGGFVGKLRWERAEGQSFRLSRPMTIEGVAKAFPTIVDFSRSTHPTDLTQSMGPVLANLPTAKGKGGNDFIDVDLALGHELTPEPSSYDERDLALYALAVGAAKDPLDPSQLKYVYEMAGEGFSALPTYGVIPAVNALVKMTASGQQAPGIHYGFERVLHGEQYLEIKRPLPTAAKLTHKAKIKDIFDKGKNALVVTAITSFDEKGREVVYNEVTTFVRGAGGWGGDRGPVQDVNVPPERAPDAVFEEKIPANAALLYRLTGDINPLHADPAFAKNFGFQRPILHGLCTFGYAARHVLEAFAGGDARLFKSIKVRFADSVFPGETLKTEMWRESKTRVVLRTSVVERSKVCLSNAAVELFDEPLVPRADKAAAPAAAAGAPAAASAASPSREVFAAITAYVAAHPELVGKTQSLFGFQLSEPDSAWTLDLATGAGSVTEGAPGKSDATFVMADADFLAMVRGEADAQKLYFGGKLKIKGNMMAAQKLSFLRDAAKEAQGKPAAATAAAPAAAAPPAPKADKPAPKAVAPAIFGALEKRLAAGPAPAGVEGAVFQFTVTEPDASFVVDFSKAPGAVRSGKADAPTVTVRVTDADLVSLAKSEVTPAQAFQQGKIRVTGQSLLAHALGFLAGLA